MLRAAALYLQKGRTLVIAQEETSFGTRDVLPIVEVTGLSPDLQGSAVLFVLSCCREAEADMTPNYESPVVSYAKVRTWSEFAKSARHMLVHQSDDIVQLIPSRYEGSKYGYKPLLAEAIPTSADARAIGAALSIAWSATL